MWLFASMDPELSITNRIFIPFLCTLIFLRMSFSSIVIAISSLEWCAWWGAVVWMVDPRAIFLSFRGV